MLEELDQNISILMESTARVLKRRRFLGGMMKGVVAATAGLALGTFENIRSAFATTCPPKGCSGCQTSCDCCYIGGDTNANCPKYSNACTFSGCPMNCSACTSTDSCGGLCIYSNGSWCACNCLGKCGNGWKICTDCKCSCSNNCNGKCNGVSYYLCTCMSGIICSNCCNPKDVEAEMRRIAAVLSAA